MASEGVTVIKTTTKENGEKVKGRWENVKVGPKGKIMESTGVTKTVIEFNADGVKEEVICWKNIKVGASGEIVASE